MLNNILAICNPSLNVLLYCDCQLDNHLNETIFHEVQKFIAESKCFDHGDENIPLSLSLSLSYIKDFTVTYIPYVFNTEYSKTTYYIRLIYDC